MLRTFCRFAACTLALCVLAQMPLRAQAMPGPLESLQLRLAAATMHAPGNVALEVKDLATGYATAVNAGANMPAASVIKIPVMVEVFRQMADGRFDLNKTLHVTARDRDWGWGDLADAPSNTPRSVSQLLRLMIEESDNTATNMLIRLVGRTHINATMQDLGLRNTWLGDDIRSEGDIRSLRTSPRDMVSLLERIARDQLVDDWSSREMLAILTGQHHNGLIPAPLPRGLAIAHKTGTLHDTLNDVGIVYLTDEPYVIAVMTTHLPSLDLGRSFIRRVSRLAFASFENFAHWRTSEGLPGFVSGVAQQRRATQPLAPDLQMWTNGSQSPSWSDAAPSDPVAPLAPETPAPASGPTQDEGTPSPSPSADP